MRRTDFSYELPQELIAQHPPAERSGGRLLQLDGASGGLDDLRMADFPRLLRKGDLLILNDTRVIPARVHGAKPTGGQVEILLERVLGGRRILAHVHANKSLRPEAPVQLPGGVEARLVGRQGDLFELELTTEPLAFFQAHGETPLPPYIRREMERADRDDRDRYQTVFAREWGAVAAPTAGLHFDQAMLDEIASLGIERATVTLHVGAGTFQSVRVDNLDEHRMHHERVEVDEKVCAAVAATRARGGRVVAVGTTVVRSLESAARGGSLKPLRGETDLFIRPGFKFQVVDAMLTNFHLPESTLLMLVCAFAGYENVMAAYRHAVEARYRFFSYGDAMFVTPKVVAT